MSAAIKPRRWVKRGIEIHSADKVIPIRYSGRGIGTEKLVIADQEIVAHSPYGWFVPHFEAQVGDDRVVVRVGVWPWLALRSFLIDINGETVYAEGRPLYAVSRSAELRELIAFLVLLIVAPLLLFLFVEQIRKSGGAGTKKKAGR